MNNGSRKNSLTNVIDNTNVKSKNESNLSMSSKVAIYRIGTETLTEIDEDSQEDIDEQKKKRISTANSYYRMGVKDSPNSPLGISDKQKNTKDVITSDIPNANIDEMVEQLKKIISDI